MKTTSTLLFVVLFNFIILPVLAQVKLGIEAGVNLHSLGYNFEDEDEEEELKDATDYRPGFNVGLTAELSLTDAIGLQPSLQLTNRRFKIEDEEAGQSFELRNSLYYLQLPVLLTYKIGALQIHAGPYAAYGLSGQGEFDQNFTGGQEDGEIRYIFRNDVSESDLDELEEDEVFLRRMDYGIKTGLGYRVGSVMLSASYMKGFSHLIPEEEREGDEDDKVTQKGFHLALTWFFR